MLLFIIALLQYARAGTRRLWDIVRVAWHDAVPVGARRARARRAYLEALKPALDAYAIARGLIKPVTVEALKPATHPGVLVATHTGGYIMSYYDVSVTFANGIKRDGTIPADNLPALYAALGHRVIGYRVPVSRLAIYHQGQSRYETLFEFTGVHNDNRALLDDLASAWRNAYADALTEWTVCDTSNEMPSA